MKATTQLLGLVLFIGAACSASAQNRAATAAQPPNIIVIFADDLGYGDLGCYGAKYPTPALDRMAEEGFRSTDMIVPANVCSPSRSALLTGRYPMRNGHPFYRSDYHTKSGSTYGLHPDEITLAELLEPAGYRSLAVGKWHLGFEKKGAHPMDAGFDAYYGYPKNSGKVSALYRDRAIEETKVPFQKLTQSYNREVVKFIREQPKNQPFFIYMAHQIAHSPILPSKSFVGLTKKGKYADFVSELDDSVGQVLQAVRDSDRERNTLLVFLADNGHAGPGSAGPLSGSKYTTKEGGHRVAGIFHWPGTIPAGQVSDTTITSMDLFPLFADLADVELPGDRKIDGFNIRDILMGKTKQSPHKFLYYYNGLNLQAVRKGQWKLHLPRTRDDQPYWGKNKRNAFAELADPFLVDLDADIGETTNVAEQHPEILAALSKEAERIRGELGDVGRVGSDQRPGWPPAASLAPVSHPNVVLIFADDLGYGDVGCYGATKVRTPHIDRLAAEGRRFTDAHSASAVCTPSRYALLTGEYPLRGNEGRGIWGPCGQTSPLLIDTDKLTIAKVLKKRGYDTACFGKWHLGFGHGDIDWNGPLRPGPLEVGFDYYFGLPLVNSGSPFVYVENDRIVGLTADDPIVFYGRKADRKTMKPAPITPLPPEAGGRSGNRFGGALAAHKLYNDYEVGTTFAQRAAKWIRERKDNPFFLYLATTNVHHPITPAPRFQGTSDCGLYGDYIHELDWMVGEVMKALEEKGVADDTLVIFTSDNGGMFNMNGQDAFKHGHRINGDLLGFKFGAWEGGHRVPFIAKWPGRIKPGTTSKQLICNADLLATFAALTGQPLSKKERADSVNILPALVGSPATPVRDELIVAASQRSHLSIRRGKWMFIDGQGSGGFGGSTPGGHGFAGPAAATFSGHPNSDIVDGKLRPDAPPGQLYDLEADVNQTRNVYNAFPEVVKELRATLRRIRPAAQPRAPRPRTTKDAPRIPAAPSKRSVALDFESGKLAPWKQVEGAFAHVIGNRDEFFRNQGTFNKQGTYYLTTLEMSATDDARSDKQTGVIVSPLFIPKAGPMTFRVGGGGGKDTYVALCRADGAEVQTARGVNAHSMQSARWDLTPYAGKKMFLKIVDQSTGGWGHITADNFQFDGEILTEYAE